MQLIIDAVTKQNLIDVVSDNVKRSMVVRTFDMSIADFITTVTAAAGSAKIGDLRIWQHGYVDRPNGNLIFGTDVLDATTFEPFRPALSRLQPYFAPGARAELRGCAAAKGTGEAMMNKLADVWNVQVHASASYQPLVLMWQGQVVAAIPRVPGVRPIPSYDTNAP